MLPLEFWKTTWNLPIDVSSPELFADLTFLNRNKHIYN